jgi:gliding motility-associated-like protein
MQADAATIDNCGHQNSSGNIYTIDASGCVTITRGTTTGYNLDTLCVIICDLTLNVCDTTLLIASNLPQAVVDTTVFDTLPVSTIDTICVTTPPGNDVLVTGCNDSISGTGALGTWTIQNGCLVYTAGTTKGNDTICVKACDTILHTCATTTVIITVTGLPPIAVNDSVKITPNTSVTIPVLVNDTTKDNDPLDLCNGIEIVSGPENGMVIVNNDGTITYIPSAGYTGRDSFEYQICDPDGADTARVWITIIGCDIPNAFSPNSDGINETFYIPCINGIASLRIFNRWGIEVYKNDHYDNTWDGSYNGSPLPDGTYYYILKFINSEGQSIDKASFVVIHR